MTARPQQWGAAYCVEAETWHGPYDTIGDAIDAAAELAEDEEIDDVGAICDCEWPDPADFAARVVRFDDVLERMDELAFDDCCFSDDTEPLFVIGDPGTAVAIAALEAAIRAWASTYVRATAFTAKDARPARQPVTP